LVQDVAAASAAVVVPALPELAALPSDEAYARLCNAFENAITAHEEARSGWGEN
jgi:hypothetical protein